jgi:ribonuclease R
MTKKKKTKKNQNRKKLSAKDLRKKIEDLFQSRPKGRMGIKEILRRIKVGNSIDAVEASITSLVQDGTLYAIADGAKYKLNQKPNKSNSKSGGSKMATGYVDTTRTGAAYIMSEDSGLEKDIFVPQGRLANALKGDFVQVRFYMRRGRPEGEIIEVLRRQREAFVGTLVLSKQFCFVIPDDEAIPVDILVSRKATMDAKNGDKVVVNIIKWHPKHGVDNPVGEVTAVLGQVGSSDIEMKAILIKQGFNLHFPKEVLAENEAINIEITDADREGRRDFRKITTFTIDPETAKDFDDALSIEMLENGNYEIGIHIADVTHYVEEGSELDKEAAKRTTSVYLVDRVLPMLPEKLSNGVCSLRPKEEKLTFSAVFEFTPDGNIVNEWFGKTIIFSDRRFTYEEAQEGLESAEGDYADELRLLNKFAHKMRKARFKKGAMNFESPEVRFVLDEDGTPLDTYVKERKDAHMLVEDFMLLANKRVGKKVMDVFRNGATQVPFVYRVHDEPDMEKVENFRRFASSLGYNMNIKSIEGVSKAYGKMLKEAEGTNELDVLQQLAIRTMAKAEYSTNNIGHYGLHFEDYAHFTSPIRRYADVLVHRIFNRFLNNEPTKYDFKKLDELCAHISRRERNAMDAERESIKYKQTEFLQNHLEEVFEGAITGLTDFGVFVSIKANHCEGMVRYENMFDNFVLLEDGLHIKSPSATYRMGDTVYIRVLSADLAKRKIEMALLDPVDAIAEIAEYEEESEAPVEEELVEEKVVKTPEKKKVTSVKQLFEQIKTVFDESDIRVLAEQKGKNWNYALAETPMHKKSMVFLGFNPQADGDADFEAEEKLPNTTFDQKKWKAILPTVLEQYKDLNPDKIVDTYFCPSRSQEEGQLSQNDLAASQEIFENWINILSPNQVICFSARLRDYLLHQDLVEGVDETKVLSGKRKIRILKGQLNIGNKQIAIAFLPSLKSSWSKAAKAEALAWIAG